MGSLEPSLREAYCVAGGDNHVIQNSDVDESQRLADPSGDLFIRMARLRDAARMIVRQDGGSGVVAEGFFDDLPVIDGCPVDSSAEENFAGNQTVPVINKDQGEYFILEHRQAGSQEICRKFRRGEYRTFPDAA
jgi:hypothetical protein